MGMNEPINGVNRKLYDAIRSFDEEDDPIAIVAVYLNKDEVGDGLNFLISGDIGKDEGKRLAKLLTDTADYILRTTSSVT